MTGFSTGRKVGFSRRKSCFDRLQDKDRRRVIKGIRISKFAI